MMTGHKINKKTLPWYFTAGSCKKQLYRLYGYGTQPYFKGAN